MRVRAPKADIGSAIRYNEIQIEILVMLVDFLTLKLYHAIDNNIGFNMMKENLVKTLLKVGNLGFKI